MTPGTGWQPSDEFLLRLKRSYSIALKQTGQTAGMWRDIDARRADLHDALLGDDLETLRRMIADPLSTDLYYGVDGICRSDFGARQDDEVYKRDVQTMLRGALRRLFIELTASDTIDFANLDIALDHRVEMPSPFAGEIGLPTERGLATERAIAAIYQAKLISETVHQIPAAQRSVVEIGPGVGRTAYYAVRAGVADYTTIDLPMGTIAQACFLSATLGPDRVWLLGDAPAKPGQIKLLVRRPDRAFGLAVNVDSLPEMPLGTAFDYIAWINRHARHFLSINHEGNAVRVAEIAALALPKRGAERRGHPMRPGYFEERFDIDRPRLLLGSRQRLQAAVLSRRIGAKLERMGLLQSAT